MTPTKAVRCEIQNGIARVTLNRPEARNGINHELALALAAAARRCETDSSVRVVLLTGAGENFSAGGDLKAFAAQGEALPAHLREVTASFHAAIASFTHMRAPVIAAVQGAAAGGGFSIACASDVVIAADTASFVFAYSRIGLVPDGGCSYSLPRLVGMRRAMELALFNRRLAAAEAQAWGIVTEVVPAVQLVARSEAVARLLADGPTGSFAAAKQLFHAGWRRDISPQMEAESRAMVEAAGSADGREGVAALLEKRAPRFTGK
jgi:2-(1,2-epoxy-1,2-dihydrophenyl)acetyl-CoA isomerase